MKKDEKTRNAAIQAVNTIQILDLQYGPSRPYCRPPFPGEGVHSLAGPGLRRNGPTRPGPQTHHRALHLLRRPRHHHRPLAGAAAEEKCEQDHEFGYEMMKRMTQVVIHRLQATRKQLLPVRR